MAAASAGHADVVKQLLAAGSDRWLRRWNGETAATLASFQGHEDVLASLFDVERFSIELMHEKATEPGGKDAARHADALVCAGDLAGRSGDFGKAASLYRQALEAIPERDDATPQRLPVLVRFSMRRRQQRNMMWRCSIWSVRSLSVRPWHYGIPRLRLSAKRSRICMASSPAASFFANVRDVQ